MLTASDWTATISTLWLRIVGFQSDCIGDGGDATREIGSERVLPQSDDGDVCLPEGHGNQCITLCVSFDLEFPKGGVAVGYVPAIWTSMPETAIEKDSNSRLIEVDVGFSGYGGSL